MTVTSNISLSYRTRTSLMFKQKVTHFPSQSSEQKNKERNNDDMNQTVMVEVISSCYTTTHFHSSLMFCQINIFLLESNERRTWGLHIENTASLHDNWPWHSQGWDTQHQARTNTTHLQHNFIDCRCIRLEVERLVVVITEIGQFKYGVTWKTQETLFTARK